MNFLLEPIQLFAARCNGSFLGFPTWHKYLDHKRVNGTCDVRLAGINDLWLIALAMVDILLRVAVLIAIAFVLIGGFKYITSRANPDKTVSARNTILDALIGLVIALAATAIVSYIGRSFN